MRKQEFLENLRKRLSGLPQSDIDERLTFYDEMIDDRMEEGLSEEAAVSGVGDIETIAGQIVADIPLAKLVKETISQKRKLSAFEIVLLVLGAPIWFSLLVAAFAVALSLYVSAWSVIISLWAVFVSLAICGVFGVIAGVIFAATGYVPSGIATIGAGILCAGLAIFFFYGCTAISNGILHLTTKIASWIKKGFIRKEEA